jgi:hypothetical protein
VKTTVEIPDVLFRQAKAAAARRGVSLKQLFNEALRERLRTGSARTPEQPWMRAFGGLRDLHRENVRIDRSIEEEFERIDEEDWR